MTEAVISSAARTPVGRYGGALREAPPAELGAIAARAAIERAGIDATEVDHLVFGNVIQEDVHLARAIAERVGVPDAASALAVSALGASGAQAIIAALQAIATGEAGVVLAGGAESMSRGPYWIPGIRWGASSAEAQVVDPVVAASLGPGPSVEEMAISRERQDELALQLHRRAELAPREDDVVAVPVGASVVDRDELARPGASPEELAALPPLFREDGTITVGNSAPMADGAAAVVLMSAERARDLGAPLGAAVSAYARRGTTEGAIRAALARHVDIIELDEPFAARLLAVIDELELDPERVNPSGGVIALGRPIGATGALSAVRLLAEMRRGGHRAGLVAVGGVALVLELAARSTAASGP